MDILQQEFYGNNVTSWAISLGVAMGVFTALQIMRIVVVGKLKKLVERFRLSPASHVLNALSHTKFLLLLALSLSAGALYLDLPDKAETLLSRAIAISLFIQAGIWIISFYDSWYENYRKKYLGKNPSAVTTLGAARFLVVIVVWTCVLLLTLDNLGFNVTTLLAGLGIGGIAVALAVQNILGDVIAALSIIVDKPFVVGDVVAIAENIGTVESIGLKATRIRSLSGEELIFTNSDLLASRIRNFGRMYERRIVSTLGVTYQTPVEKLEAIPAIIREAIEAQEKVRFDRAHFKTYGAFSLDFEYVYFVLSGDYALYMDTQQAINLAIFKRFAKEGIDFAYPTQTLFIERNAAA